VTRWIDADRLLALLDAEEAAFVQNVTAAGRNPDDDMAVEMLRAFRATVEAMARKAREMAA
jgi:hypothetical protein